jgi:subtilisin family serine protease
MSTEVRVPDLGDFRDVPVAEIHVRPGDPVKRDDPLVTLETDKATMEVPADQDGTVEAVLVKVGDKVSEGSPVLRLRAPDDLAATPPPSHSARQQPTSAPEPFDDKSSESDLRRPGSSLDRTEPTKQPFDPEVLDKTIIAIPLLNRIKIEASPTANDDLGRMGGLDYVHDIIIDVNLDYQGGREKAKEHIEMLVGRLFGSKEAANAIDTVKSKNSHQYLFGRLSGHLIRDLVRADAKGSGVRAIYRIWPDFEVQSFTNRSVSTIKADAARNAFGALGDEITWAVIDTGIDGEHPHFRKHKNLKHHLLHRDFTGVQAVDDSGSANNALEDQNGHGTHVAGIIAGAATASKSLKIEAFRRLRDEIGDPATERVKVNAMSGMAPRCKLLSLKALDEKGKGKTSPDYSRAPGVPGAAAMATAAGKPARRLLHHPS